MMPLIYLYEQLKQGMGSALGAIYIGEKKNVFFFVVKAEYCRAEAASIIQ